MQGSPGMIPKTGGRRRGGEIDTLLFSHYPKPITNAHRLAVLACSRKNVYHEDFDSITFSSTESMDFPKRSSSHKRMQYWGHLAGHDKHT